MFVCVFVSVPSLLIPHFEDHSWYSTPPIFPIDYLLRALSPGQVKAPTPLEGREEVVVSYFETTSEDLFGRGIWLVLYLRTVLGYMRVPVPIFCCLPLFPSIMPTSQWAHQPSLISVAATKEITRDNFLVRFHRPAGSWDTVRDGGGAFLFLFFCRGGPCPPGAYNLAGETQLMHIYTVITISNYHNIDHNCVRPGKRSMRDWGLGGVLLILDSFTD